MDYITVKHSLSGETVKAIPLARYKHFYSDTIVKKYRFLWLKKEKYEYIEYKDFLYLVFVPWKHKEKELIVVKQSDVISGLCDVYEGWIKVEKYISIPNDVYLSELEVSDFYGLPFIYEHTSFVANQVDGEYWDNLEVLYKEMPELLNEEFE